ncbi:MAG: SufD family Fe-S cluster assembly protein [Helcococcus sp.]|nr:SufD family Fe-S cluster assembly protein [Helcococcus sp.]
MISVNRLPHLTWRQTGANEVFIDDIKIEKKNFDTDIVSKTAKGFIENFNEEFGISKEILELNEEYKNHEEYFEFSGNEDIKREFHLKENQNILNDVQNIFVKEGADATIIFDYKSSKDIEAFRNSVIRIKAQKNSKLQIVLIQRLNHKSKSFINMVSEMEEDAHIQLVQIEIGALKSYLNYRAYINGERAESDIKTAYFVDGKRYLDINYLITHRGRETKSDMLVNGVLKDRAEKRFTGTLDFNRESTLSEGSEEEFVTLLDPTVKNRAIPILLAREDNIVGIHAASAGRIDKDMLFYITSRGFNHNEAKRIIIESKIKPILDYIKDEKLVNEILEEIRERIK